MIDFRYHIVSIAAVFLALGIGVALGATVLDRVTVDALEGRLDDLRGNLDDARSDITDLQGEVDRSRSLLTGIGPHATDGVLEARRFLVVAGRTTQEWEGETRTALTEAGATDVGTLSLTERWADPDAVEELTETFTDLGLEPPDPGAELAEAVPELLGATITSATGRALLAELTDAGFLSTSGGEPAGTWPPPDADVVVFTSSEGEDARIGPMAAFARGAASITPTLVVSGSLEDQGALARLRGDPGLPQQLSTFDSAEVDDTGAGAVLALRAAIEGRGGHFGSAEGSAFFPSPA